MTPTARVRVFFVVFVVVGLLAWSRDPDLATPALVAKYGVPPSQFLELPSGARAHYRDEGKRDGAVLLLLHGSNSSLHTWSPWVRLLSDTFRVLTVDLPGHGLTGPVPGDDYSPDGMGAFVEQFRQTLAIPRFFLAGNSMGGNVSWRYAVAHPDAVEKLVLVDSSGLNFLLPADRQPKVPIAMKIQRTPGLNLLTEIFTPRRAVEKSLQAIFVDQSKITPEMVDRYWDLLRRPGNRRAGRLRAGVPIDTSSPELVSRIHVPTLILSGTEDTLVPVEAARIFHEKIPGSKLIEYPNVGHVPMEEIPEQSAADVKAFLLGS